MPENLFAVVLAKGREAGAARLREACPETRITPLEETVFIVPGDMSSCAVAKAAAIANEKEPNAPGPDRYMERDVSDFRVTVGKFGERIEGIGENMAAKADLADANVELWKGKAEMWKFASTPIAPLLAAAIGAFAAMFAGPVRIAAG